MTIGLVTFIYPKVIKFLDELISSIRNQSSQDLNLCIFNDGVNNVEKYFDKLNNINIEFIKLSGSPTEIRYQALKILSTSNYDKIIFQDADDLMTNNRIEKCCLALEEYDIVINDLDLIDQNKNPIQLNYWGARIKDGFTFDYKFIQNKNIVGFGNTAIKREILLNNFKLGKIIPIAADWFFFYQLMAQSKKNAIFITQSKTLYRQHTDNITGLNHISKQRIQDAIHAKIKHYSALNEINYNFVNELETLNSLILQSEFVVKNNPNPFFWWEETEYIIDENENKNQ